MLRSSTLKVFVPMIVGLATAAVVAAADSPFGTAFDRLRSTVSCKTMIKNECKTDSIFDAFARGNSRQSGFSATVEMAEKNLSDPDFYIATRRTR